MSISIRILLFTIKLFIFLMELIVIPRTKHNLKILVRPWERIHLQGPLYQKKYYQESLSIEPYHALCCTI